MTSHVLLTLILVVVITIIFLAGRRLYLRSLKVRRRLQLSNIFTNITHELLTPLTVISASVDRMRNEDPKFNHDYDLMQLNIQRMVRLLQQILETSKSEAGELKLLVAQGDVMRYIRETAESIEPLIAKKKMKYTITCQPESMMGWIDTDKLDKIIYNLLSNAAKYATENSEVTIKALTNKNFDHIIIKVSDTGKGISPEMMKQLFKRFHDGDYRKSHTIGTGLGLALTQDLVYLHKGTIDVESEVGKGTTFTVTIPINKEAFSANQIDEQHKIDFDVPKNSIMDINAIIPDINAVQITAVPDDNQAHKILIVEDNLELLMLMQQLLKAYYHVYLARDGEEAFEIVHKNNIDLIISDVMMPKMNGLELTLKIKEDEKLKHLPIILLTAKTQEEDEQLALEAGADDYIIKPFRIKDLKLRIDNIIENRKRMQIEPISQAENEKPVEKPLSPNEQFVNRALEFVHEHLEDEDYDRDALAADMGTSASTLYNKLRAITGMNVSTFIRDIRMKEAKRLAEQNPTIRVSDLAYSVGFHDPRYFSTCFKKQFGIQPKEYLENLQRSTPEK